jgi:ADP-dependent NAD(P)H-hydrate dehydratase / NAD(P)H-hydrate epimerase
MRIVGQAEMKEIETSALEKYNFSESLVVENIGVKGADYLYNQLITKFPNSEIIFLVGKGNNGADGLAMARHLTNKGLSIRAFTFFSEEESSDECLRQIQLAKSYGLKFSHLTGLNQLESYVTQLRSNFIFIDAIFGTGVRLPLSNLMYDVINFVNQNSSFTVAVDIPSGVVGDTGVIQGNAIKADLTLSVALPKIGYYMGDGSRVVGEIVVLDAGFPIQLINEKGDKFLLGLEDTIEKASKRNKFGDKKIFGHTLVIGGSHGLTGALTLASQAALKVGAGLVTGVTWEKQYQDLLSRLIPEIMTGYIPMDQTLWPRLIKDLNDRYDSIVIGPGLARSARARRIVLDIISNYSGPLVIDADAINVLNLKEDYKLLSRRNAPTVLTPHFGEFASFCDIDIKDLNEKPLHYLNELIERINCSVVLKGACTFIGSPNGKTFINFFPNDGMATGGSGDVLAGILGGLLGQSVGFKEKHSLYDVYESFDKVIGLSVLIHSLAGKHAAKDLGVRAMSATSLIDSFSNAFADIDERLDHIEGI